jgi:hypothetical protein
MKERDSSFPNMITKTKSKRYVAVCPICNTQIGSVFQFRIQASQSLRYHLEKKHQLYS